MHGACLGDAASACLIMELVPGGNLAERIYNPHKRRMSHLEILQVGAEMHPGAGPAPLLERGGAARLPQDGWPTMTGSLLCVLSSRKFGERLLLLIFRPLQTGR